MAKPLRAPVGPAEDRIAAFVAIEALNLWTGFARSFYLSSALGARTLAGQPVVLNAASISTRHDAIGFAVLYFKPRANPAGPWTWLDEPAWRQPKTLVRLVGALGASNEPQVLAAFGIPCSVFKQLPRVRNFYAHRGKDTARQVDKVARSLRMAAARHPSNLICSRAPSRPQNVVCDWLDELRVVIDTMSA